MCPGIGYLREKVENCVGDRVGRNHCFVRSLRFAGANSGCIDLSVNDNVNNMNAVRVELAGKRLREHA